MRRASTAGAGNRWEELHKDGVKKLKDIRDDDGLLLLDGAEWVLLLVLP